MAMTKREMINAILDSMDDEGTPDDTLSVVDGNASEDAVDDSEVGVFEISGVVEGPHGTCIQIFIEEED